MGLARAFRFFFKKKNKSLKDREGMLRGRGGRIFLNLI